LANDDLLSIKEYIEKELDNPPAAANTLMKITTDLRALVDFPLSGALISGSYISFYHYIDDTVFIDRVLYARRDYIKILFGDIEE